MSGDWRDGFLFVANQLSLDFLNTRPMIDGSPRELLPDSAALLRWLVAAGLLTEQQAGEASKVWPAKSAAGLEKLREFREDYRRVVLEMEAGRPPAPAFIGRVNALLAEHAFVDEIVRSDPGWKRKRRFDPRRPEDAFGPLLDDAANLLTNADRSKIRKCAKCVLHFYDTSKKGTRRWCSMNLCGNRAKVAAYARRKRDEE
jgi:predicted RNA-binding Zn ribbon-like protein